MSELSRPSTRRDFLRHVSAGAALVTGAGMVLEACGSTGSSGSSAASSPNAGTPTRGGTLKVACTGGSSTDTLDPQVVNTNPDLMRASMLYDSLVTYDENAQPVLQLAEEITPNHDGSVWTIRLRPGIEFHNGKTMTPQDVLFTFRRITDPKAPKDAASQLAFMDLSSPQTKIVDSRTLTVASHYPIATFSENIVWAAGSGIVPVGFDPKNPIGTGPWKFQSWQANVQSTFDKFDNYWQSGVPYLDSVQILELADDTAQVNALQSGAVDCLAYCEATTIKEIQSLGYHTIASPGGYWNPITMRVDQKPFDDVRVRQAFRLIMDRPAVNEQVFDGLAVLGNDLYARWDSEFDSSLPQRTQDLDKAKFLLKQAGAEGLTTTLVTSDVTNGFMQTATVFAQQAKAAGVTINLQVVPPTTFFGPDYLKRTFSQDVWNYNPYWSQVALTQVPGAPYNEVYWNEPSFTALYKQGISTLDESKRRDIAHQLQVIDYDTGGYIVPAIVPNLSAYASHVHGLTASKCGIAFNCADFKQVWIS